MLNNKGFTLIELIASLVIVGIIVVVAGMGIVRVTQGLVFSQKNASTSLKTQVALTRIEKELHIATSISSSSSSSTLTFTNNKGGGTATYTLCRNGTYIDLDPANSCIGNNHLIDNVGSLAIAYWALDGTTSAAPTAAKIIDVTFQISGGANVASTFTMRIAPRML